VTAFQRQRAETRAAGLERPQLVLFEQDASDMDAAEAERHQFRATSYETVRQLLDALPLPSGHWAEPCAGDGAIIKHVAKWCDAAEKPRPTFWTAIELRRNAGLDALAEHPWLYTRDTAWNSGGPGQMGAHGRIWAHEGSDLRDWTDPLANPAHGPDKGVSVCITNLPWYGWTTMGLVERMRRLWPVAHIVALTCTRECLDGERPAWFRDHMPSAILRCAGRQRLASIRGGQPTNGYPHPVEWLHWKPGVINAPETLYRVLE
jgi:hypothetical protein